LDFREDFHATVVVRLGRFAYYRKAFPTPLKKAKLRKEQHRRARNQS
jgi:hypothetical protein